MMNNNLLAKIVANSTDSTWSQSYSTLNLYITLSVEKQNSDEENIASFGKELLEKLQREFFAQDKKNLLAIKEAVEKSVSEPNPNFAFSIILATIVSNILYIVIANRGSVVIKRAGKIGIVAAGEEDKIISFSGVLEKNDILILETEGFSKKIPFTKLSSLVDNLIISEISESLAPIVHEESKGTEAAIIIQYIVAEEKPVTVNDQPEVFESKKGFPLIGFLINKIKQPKNIGIPHFNFNFKNKRLYIAGLIIVVLIIFSLVLVFEKQREQREEIEQRLEAVIIPAQKKYDEGVALVSLNKNLAIDNLNEAKNNLEVEKSNFPEKSQERNKIDELLNSVNIKLKELEGSSVIKNQNQLFEANSDIKEIGAVTFKGGDLIVADKTNGNIVLLSKSDGKITKTMKTQAKNITAVTADTSSIYTLGDNGGYKTDKASGKSQKIFSDMAKSIDTFLGNVYTLDGTVNKYPGGSGAKATYFTDKVTLTDPMSMAIDSSVWITQADGKIRKFTKGKEDGFSLNGLGSKGIGKNAMIYTDSKMKNIYVLDKDNKKLIVIAKDGNFQNQYSVDASTNSFCIDETAKKAYVLTGNKIFTFDL